jgi:predicted permease
VLGFTIALAVITCVLFGLAPALRGTQIGPLAVLKTASRTISGDRDRSTLRRALVVGQVALSLVLLVGALLFARTLNNLGAVDPGFRDRGVLVAVIDLRRLQLQPERRAGAVRDVLDRLGALPGIERVSSVAVVPISGGSWSNAVWTGGDSRRAVNSYFNRVSRGYFDTLRIPLRAGRDFDPDIDTPPSVPVAIVNETLARQLFGAERALGGKFTVESTPGEPERTFEVVGIVSDAKYFTLREPPEPTAFLAKSQEARVAPFLQVVFRSALPDEAATAAVTRSLSDADPRISVTYRVLTAQIDRTVTRERLMATLSAFFGGLAVLLTLVGLYGVVAYGVMRRTNEIGVRIALGATTRDILAMVVGEAGVLVAIGLAIGLMLSIAGGHAAATLLYGLEPRDPATLLAAVAALSAVAFAATYLPARAATRIEPTSALRTE